MSAVYDTLKGGDTISIEWRIISTNEYQSAISGDQKIYHGISASAVTMDRCSLTVGDDAEKGKRRLPAVYNCCVWRVLASQSKGQCRTNAVCMGAATQKGFISQRIRCRWSSALWQFDAISAMACSIVCVVTFHTKTRSTPTVWFGNVKIIKVNEFKTSVRIKTKLCFIFDIHIINTKDCMNLVLSLRQLQLSDRLKQHRQQSHRFSAHCVFCIFVHWWSRRRNFFVLFLSWFNR